MCTEKQKHVEDMYMSMNNNAPEKLWIDPSTDLPKLSGHIDKNSIEYTRTDAFIKKACEGIERLLSGYIIRNFHFGDSYEMDTLIDDFKNYLKGE